MTKINLSLLFLVFLLFFGCNMASKKDTINKKELISVLKQDSVKIIDVRTKEEYEEAHIPNAINYPIESLEDSLIHLDKSEKIIVVCRTGNKSRKATKLLLDNGFERVYDAGKWQNTEKILKELEK